MAKWILASERQPKEGEEILGVFDHMPSDVWHSVRHGTKFLGDCLDGEGTVEIVGELVCWMMLPKSPFKGSDW